MDRANIRAIIIDIEGTVTPVSFVTTVLFPYAREHLPAFIAANQDAPEVAHALAEARALLGEGDFPLELLSARLIQWIDEDHKATPLKALQGFVWREAYENGAFVAPIFPDVAGSLQAWNEQGKLLCVYSSGSVDAQQLLFRHTSSGDLLPLFHDVFDTRAGAKVVTESYTGIAVTLGLHPSRCLFLTDNAAEVAAAQGAGWQVIRIDREVPALSHVTIERDGLVATSFEDVATWLNRNQSPL
ncbi:MAG: acireductone synthase [Chloroflexota bacterium]